MNSIFVEDTTNGLSSSKIEALLSKALQGKNLKKVLLVPPDITRRNSGAGLIVSLLYKLLKDIHVDILPALGTHVPMTAQEQTSFFGKEIPSERYLIHDWRNHITKIGEVSGDFISNISEGLISEPMSIEISDYLLDPSYDLILSIGQVVPHEVVGMANYTKNIVVGCGGSSFINHSHFLGAVYGMERIMGKVNTPVRKVFDYVQKNFLDKLPIEYILTVTVSKDNNTNILGLYIGKERDSYERAASLSQKFNLNFLNSPVKTCVVWLDEHEFHSTWLGNKAIYRTRMAMADGGKLIILAPGINRFGEDDEIDRLIRKFGYVGRDRILSLCKTEDELKNNLSAAAHLIHGSTDGRFKVTYATDKLSKDDIEGVGFDYMSLSQAKEQFEPQNLTQGYNKLQDGQEVFFIGNPSIGLWTTKAGF